MASGPVLSSRPRETPAASRVAILDRYSKSIGESKASIAFLERHSRWQQRLPAPEQLWDWLTGLDLSERVALLAHCVSITVDAVRRPQAVATRHMESETLANALSLDMAEWWRPTAANYLNAVTKEQIIAAVSEGVSAQEARRLAGLKKPEMVVRAEKLLHDTRWLPQPLRSTTEDKTKAQANEQEAAK